MALILNIDTATEAASVCLAKNGDMVQLLRNADQKDHAAWMHIAIADMLSESGFAMRDLDAVAITAGPGSYTGLRVGMAAAKGFCFALQVPLITENTLKTMAFAASCQLDKGDYLLCPMIDARRMEVFTALYNGSLDEIMQPAAVVLDERSFETELQEKQVAFFGNGSEKWQMMATSPRAIFVKPAMDAGYLGKLSFRKFTNHQFTDIIYSEPVYTKEFYTHTKK